MFTEYSKHKKITTLQHFLVKLSTLEIDSLLHKEKDN